MSVASVLYGNVMKALANKEIDLDSDDIRVMLLDSGYTPSQDSHDYLNDVVANEVNGTGYTAGGLAVTGKTLTYSGGSNLLTFDHDDPEWADSTITARFAVWYDRTPATDATRPLICYWDFGADVASSGGPFKLTLDPSGLFTATVA